MLKELWQTRQKQYVLKMLKYLKYIFNDHFVLVLFIFLGFLMVHYANFILALTPETGNVMALKLGLIVYFVAGLTIGHLATLLQPADSHFLSVLEKEWDVYFTFAKWHSMVVPQLILGGMFMLSTPILIFLKLPHYYALLGVVMSLKWGHLSLEHYVLKQNKWKNIQLTGSMIALNTLILGIAFFISPILALAFGGICAVGCHYFVRQHNGLYQWETMIGYETKRQNKLFRIIQLFVDIPLYQELPKKRTYLNKWLRSTDSMHQYLLERFFLRASSYLGLSIRLTMIEIVVLLLIPMSMASIIGVAVGYMTAFQLLPLYVHYNNELQLLGWPLQVKAKKQAFQKLMRQILTVQLLVSHVFIGILTRQFMIFVSIVAGLIFIYAIFPLYIGRKIDKM